MSRRKPPLPEMSPAQARETWVRETRRVALLAGDDPRTRGELLREWKEMTHGRQAAFRIERAVEAQRASAALEAIGGYGPAAPEERPDD